MAEPTVDKVQIEIEAKASKANDVLDQLAKNLNNVKRALTGFDTSALERIQKSLDSIESKAQSVSKTNVTPNIDTSKISTSERKISNSLENIQDKFARLSNLANAAMGGDTSALTSFKRQATSLQGDLDVLQGKLQRLGDTRIPTNEFMKLEQNIKSASDLLGALNEKKNKLYGNNQPTNDPSFVRLQNNIQKTQSILDGLIDKQRQMVADGTAYTDPFQKYRDGALSAQNALTELIAKVNAVKDNKPVVDTSRITAGIKNAIGSVTDLSKRLLSLGGSAIKGAISGIGKAFDGLKAGVAKVKDGFGGLHKFMDKGFMKILKYGFGVRSIYVGFRRLRKAVVESFGELQKSGAMWETTKSNVESLKTALATLKFQFGAAFEPIFNAVAPALESFINMLIRAFNALSAFIAKITGRSTYSKVESVTLAAAKNTGAAAKNAKELNKQLQKFDELNNLTTNNAGGGGGGGGGGGDGDSATYTEANVEDALGDFGKKLAEAIKKGDWKAVGTIISNKLSEAMESIKWNKVFNKAKNFGKNFANFLNGLITPRLFSNVGKTIANSLNTALAFLDSFGRTFNWKNFGNSIAAGINGFFEKFKFADLVSTLNIWAHGLFTTLNTAMKKISWGDISENITDGLNAIDAETLGSDVGEFAGNVVDAIYIMLANEKTWTTFGTKIAGFLNGVFKTDKKGNSIFTKVGKTLAAALNAAFKILDSFGTTFKWKPFGKSMADGINKFLKDFKAKSAGKAVYKWIKGLLDAGIALVKNTNFKLLGKKIVEFFNGLKPLELAGKLLVFAGNLIKGIAEAIVSMWKNSTLQTKIGAAIIGMLVAGKLTGLSAKLGSSIASYFIKNPITGVKAAFLIAEAKLVFDQSTKLFAQWAEFFGDDELADYYSDFSWDEFFSTILTPDGEGVDWKTIKKAWEDMLNTYFKPMFNTMKTWYETGKECVTGMVNGIKETAKDFLENAFKSPIQKMLDNVKEQLGINSPSKVFLEIGKNIIQGLINGISSTDIGEWFKTNVTDKLTTNAQAAVKINLTKGWTGTIGEWIKGGKDKADPTVKANVGLKKQDDGKDGSWSKVNDWVSRANGNNWVVKDKAQVGLKKQESGTGWWSKINEWVSRANGKHWVVGDKAQVGLTKQNDGKSGSWSTIAKWIDDHSGSKIVQGLVGLTKNWGQKTVGGWIWDNGQPLGFEAPIGLGKSGWSTVKKFLEDNFTNNIQSGTGTYKEKPKDLSHRAAEGGSFFGGAWHDIPQFANGTLNALKHGTIFAAGEAGPEVVGHINGRTEILNRSQLASTMYTAITRGMMQFRNAQMVTPQMLGFAGNIADGIATGISSTNNDSLLMEQNRLLAEQNRWLQQIANKDVTISSKDVYNATMREAQNYNNRTGNSPFLF